MELKTENKKSLTYPKEFNDAMNNQKVITRLPQKKMDF